MSRRPSPSQALSWLLAGTLALIAITWPLCGCATAERLLPPILAGAERVLLAGADRVLAHELDRAEDAARRQDLERAIALLDQARASQVAAEDAARRAAEAAALAHAEAERAARERLAAEQARRDVAARELSLVIRKLGLAEKLAAGREAGAP